MHGLLDRKRLWYMNWYLNDLLHCKRDKIRIFLALSLPIQWNCRLSTWIWHIFDHWVGLNDSNLNRHWNLHENEPINNHCLDSNALKSSYQFFDRIRHMFRYLNWDGHIFHDRHHFLFVRFIVWFECVHFLIFPFIGRARAVCTSICIDRSRRCAIGICVFRIHGHLLSFIDSASHQQQCTQVNYRLRMRARPNETSNSSNTMGSISSTKTRRKQLRKKQTNKRNENQISRKKKLTN